MKVFISSQFMLNKTDISSIRYIFEHSNSIKYDLIRLFKDYGWFVDVKPPFFNRIKIGNKKYKYNYRYTIYVDEYHLFFET